MLAIYIEKVDKLNDLVLRLLQKINGDYEPSHQEEGEVAHQEFYLNPMGSLFQNQN